MTEDISRQTVVVLVVLAVLISLLGTWTVMTELSSIRTTGTTSSIANVRFAISPTQSKPQPTTGNVVLNIIKPE